MKKIGLISLAMVALLGFAVGLVRAAAPPQADIPDNVKQLFKNRCASCHSGRKPPHGLSWEPDKIAAAINAPSTEVVSLKIIDTANPDASYILKKVQGGKDITGRRMPPGRHLPPADLETLKAWVAGLKTN
jgi:mono/diheme cytochrome c family protein